MTCFRNPFAASPLRSLASRQLVLHEALGTFRIILTRCARNLEISKIIQKSFFITNTHSDSEETSINHKHRLNTADDSLVDSIRELRKIYIAFAFT